MASKKFNFWLGNFFILVSVLFIVFKVNTFFSVFFLLIGYLIVIFSRENPTFKLLLKYLQNFNRKGLTHEEAKILVEMYPLIYGILNSLKISEQKALHNIEIQAQNLLKEDEQKRLDEIEFHKSKLKELGVEE